MISPASSSAWCATKRLVLFHGELKSSVRLCSSLRIAGRPLPLWTPAALTSWPFVRGIVTRNSTN